MKPTLLIMAAGMGSRYGGLKQFDPLGPGGETILEYSVYDALRADFGKLVFVIRRSFAETFKTHVAARFERLLETVCVFQELGSCLGDFALPAKREKPWGTAHAVLCAREAIRGPFAVINADDFYGARAFQAMAGHLAAEASSPLARCAMVGYHLRDTLSEHGHVARGLCQYDEDRLLKRVIERTEIWKTAAGAATYDDAGQVMNLSGDELVSMNFWGFYPSVFDLLQTQFLAFLRENRLKPDAECYIPTAMDKLIAAGQASVKILSTPDRWFGMTWREDRDFALTCIKQLIQMKVYPERLWPGP